MRCCLFVAIKRGVRKQEKEEQIFEMIGELDSLGGSDISIVDFVKLMIYPFQDLSGESSV